MPAPSLALTGGLLYDGLGAEPLSGTLVIEGDSICAILPPEADARSQAAQVVDVGGLAIAPGFIDVHAHGDLEPLALPGADSKLCNGVTTEVCGNCGSTPFPLEERMPGYLREKGKRLGVTVDWHNAGEFFDRLESSPAAINRLFLTGHGRLRGNVVGAAARKATKVERDQMCHALEATLGDGSFGLSSGLMYPPGCHSDLAEMIALCEVVAHHGGVYCTHLRSESDGMLDAVRESLEVARATGVTLHLSHLKLSGEPNWRVLPELKKVLEDALDEGIDLHADWYPYEAWNANLDSLLPNWVYEGGTARLLSRLRNPSMRYRLADHILELSRNGISWDRIIIASVTLEQNKKFQGRDIAEVAEELNLTPEDTLFNLILAEGGRAEGFMATMSQAVQAAIFSWSFVSVGSDAAARGFSGVTSEDFPHPRTYGTATRVLRRVREEGLLPLPEAIRRMTGLPAEHMGLADRGQIKTGMKADIVVFDPQRVADRATYRQPVMAPVGIEHVMVNGVFALFDGSPTGHHAGKFLRRG